MRAHRKPRAESSALVPGITINLERKADGYPRWQVRASAQVESGRQRLRSWSPRKLTLAGAIREACLWRFEHAPGDYASAEAMARDVWDALEPDTMQAMREAGVDVGGLGTEIR